MNQTLRIAWQVIKLYTNNLNIIMYIKKNVLNCTLYDLMIYCCTLCTNWCHIYEHIFNALFVSGSVTCIIFTKICGTTEPNKTFHKNRITNKNAIKFKMNQSTTSQRQIIRKYRTAGTARTRVFYNIVE